MKDIFRNNSIMQKKYKYCLLAFTVFFISTVRAQVFPVNITPQVIPPYSLQLSEYTTSASEKLLVNLLLTDITRSNLEIRLKLYIENNAGISIQSTDVVLGTNPIFLDGGIPLRLSNIDLQPYFALQNLTGITPQKYSTSLPEGMYRFCFEANEVISGKQISRKSCAMAYLVLNDPPFLNIPNQGEQVVMRDPQNIIFQWTPRHLNATNVEYEFTLTELWDSKMDPQALFLASQPLYQTNTFATTLLYGPSETGLLPNKSYAWRVRAMVRDGISESSVFKNDGYSEVYNFTYSGGCAEPTYILAEAKNTTSEKIYWQGVNHLKYNVQYRKKDVENAIWFEGNAVNQNITIYNLEPGTTYEFRVGGQCMENGAYTYSQIYEFTTTIASNDAITYNCGITPEIKITNQDRLQELIKEDVFTAGDFPVVVEEIRQSGGTFSGEGYIIVPYLSNLSVKVKFDNIGINTDYQLIEGIVETIYDQDSGGIVTIDDILNNDRGDNDTASNDDSGGYDPEDPYSVPNNNNEPANETEPTVVVDNPVTGNDNNNPVVDNATNTPPPIDNPTNIDDPDLENNEVVSNNPENEGSAGGDPIVNENGEEVVKGQLIIDQMYVQDKKSPNRKALAGETLYMISHKEVVAKIIAKEKEEVFNNLNLDWKTKTLKSSGDIVIESKKEYKGKNTISKIYDDVENWTVSKEDSLSHSITAVNKKDREYTVNVKMIHENSKSVAVFPDGLDGVLKKQYEKINKTLKKLQEKIKEYTNINIPVEISPLKITGSQKNVEDEDSRFYAIAREGVIEGGIEMNKELEFSPPGPLRILDIPEILETKFFIAPKFELIAKGILEELRVVDQEMPKKYNFSVELAPKGSLTGGIKTKLLVAEDLVSFSASGFAEASISGIAKYNVDENKFEGIIQLDPLVVNGEVKIKTKGFLEFTALDEKVSVNVIDAIVLYDSTK